MGSQITVENAENLSARAQCKCKICETAGLHAQASFFANFFALRILIIDYDL